MSVGFLQNLRISDVIVNPDGTPSTLFLRLIQNRGSSQMSLEEIINSLANNEIIAGDGLDGGGKLSEGSVTIDANASDILDLIDDTHGAVLFRGETEWEALPPGAAGEVLTSGGVDSDVEWAAVSSSGGGILPVVDGSIPPTFIQTPDGGLVFTEIL